MQVSLSPELEKFVNSMVAKGVYNTQDDVISSALELLAKQDANFADYRSWLHREIQLGIDQIDRGEIISAEDSERMIELYLEEIETRRSRGEV